MADSLANLSQEMHMILDKFIDYILQNNLNYISPIEIAQISSDYLKAFHLSYKKLSYRIHLEQYTDLVKQKNHCQLQWNSKTHQCYIKQLVTYFIENKGGRYYKGIDDFPSFFNFIENFRCISQLPVLLRLFDLSVNHKTLPLIIPFIERLINDGKYYRALVIADHLNIRQSINFCKYLLRFVFEGNQQDIVFFLKLDDIIYNEQFLCDDTIPDACYANEHILFKFLRTLDDIYTNNDKLKLFDLEDYIKKTGKKRTTSQVIIKYLLNLIKHPAFILLSDETIHNLCPNIIDSFYLNRIPLILYLLSKNGEISFEVLKDHITLFEQISSATHLLPSIHSSVIRLLLYKYNMYSLAQEYVFHYDIPYNIFASIPNDREEVTYPFTVLLEKNVYIIDNLELFEDCLIEIKGSKVISLDCEWLNNFFALRNSPRVSLIQIALRNIVFLIDCISLTEWDPTNNYLKRIIDEVLNNNYILKLGYGINNDYQAIVNTWKRSTDKVIEIQKNSSADMQNIYAYMTNHNIYRELFDRNRLRKASTLNGLSQLTFLLTGHVIDKKYQLSNWEQRPLEMFHIKYAALDAYCLIDCYKKLCTILENETITFLDLAKKAAHTEKICDPLASCSFEAYTVGKQTRLMKDFRCVVDTMLWGVIKYLRLCNADAIKADDHESGAKLALKENRVFITNGHVYKRYFKMFASKDDCIQLNNSTSSIDQFRNLVNRFKLIIRLEDLFVRCRFCNTYPFIMISYEEFRYHLYEHSKKKNKINQDGNNNQPSTFEVTDLDSITHVVPIDFDYLLNNRMVPLDDIPKFFICKTCGKIFWEGSQTINFIESIKELIVDAN